MPDAADIVDKAEQAQRLPVRINYPQGVSFTGFFAGPPGSDVRRILADALRRRAKQLEPPPKPASKPPTPRKPREPRERPDADLMTMGEAAAKLGVSIKTLNGHIAKGAIGYVQVGHG